MEYIKAREAYTDEIFDLVQKTIKTIYPKYYPQEVVDFFCQLHNKENIEADIRCGYVNILCDNGIVVGTGSRKDNHITRVYVLPELQGKGYGSYIMSCLESEIAVEYESVELDASLPASRLYEHRGYKTLRHEEHKLENDVVLVYEVMEKSLHNAEEKSN